MSANATVPGFTAEAPFARPVTGAFAGRAAPQGIGGDAVVPAFVECVERGNITVCYDLNITCWWYGGSFMGCSKNTPRQPL